MVLLIYTHYFGLLMLAGFVVVNWLFGPRRRAFIVAAAAAGISFLPWFLYVLPVYQARGLQTNLWWVQMLISNPLVGIRSSRTSIWARCIGHTARASCFRASPAGCACCLLHQHGSHCGG
jgi:hypothetical protein